VNQVNGAYMAGRWRQMSRLADQRPYWQYNAVMDMRTRPAHAAQHGKVYRADHPYWCTWYHPNGHRCRCVVLSLSEQEMRRLGLEAETEMPAGWAPDPGWAHNVGESGWGRGLVEAALGGRADRGDWKLLPVADVPGELPPLPEPAPMPALPEHHDRLARRMTPKEILAYYREEAVKRLGLERGPDGGLKDLPVVDAAGDRGVLAARMVEHAITEKDIARGRYVGLAREVVETAHEVWLVPGQYADGRVVFRRRYIKVFRDDKDRPMLAVSEFKRGVWEAFNVYPRTAGRPLERQRKGLLLYRAAHQGSR
jgi:hypothetical protein